MGPAAGAGTGAGDAGGGAGRTAGGAIGAGAALGDGGVLGGEEAGGGAGGGGAGAPGNAGADEPAGLVGAGPGVVLGGADGFGAQPTRIRVTRATRTCVIDPLPSASAFGVRRRYAGPAGASSRRVRSSLLVTNAGLPAHESPNPPGGDGDPEPACGSIRPSSGSGP